jgi:hypothetical protein
MGFIWRSEIDIKLVEDPMNMLRPVDGNQVDSGIIASNLNKMEPIGSMVTLIYVNPEKRPSLHLRIVFKQSASYEFRQR